MILYLVRHGIAVDEAILNHRRKRNGRSPRRACKRRDRQRWAYGRWARTGCFDYEPLHARGANGGNFRRSARIFDRENSRERCAETSGQSGGNRERDFADARERGDVFRPCSTSGRDDRAVGGGERRFHGAEKSRRRMFRARGSAWPVDAAVDADTEGVARTGGLTLFQPRRGCRAQLRQERPATWPLFLKG